MLTSKIAPDVELRLLQLHHADEVFAVVDAERAYLRKWLPWVDATTSVNDTRAFISKSLGELAEGAGLVLGVWCGGRCAGTVGCHRFDLANRRVEIGYWLAERYQGRGIITAGCRAMIEHLFGELGMERVELRAVVDNYRSRAVAERLGFREEGVLRHAQLRHGCYDDLVIYGLLREEWAEGSASRSSS